MAAGSPAHEALRAIGLLSPAAGALVAIATLTGDLPRALSRAVEHEQLYAAQASTSRSTWTFLTAAATATAVLLLTSLAVTGWITTGAVADLPWWSHAAMWAGAAAGVAGLVAAQAALLARVAPNAAVSLRLRRVVTSRVRAGGASCSRVRGRGWSPTRSPRARRRTTRRSWRRTR